MLRVRVVQLSRAAIPVNARNAFVNKSSSIHPVANPPPLSKDTNVGGEEGLKFRRMVSN